MPLTPFPNRADAPGHLVLESLFGGSAVVIHASVSLQVENPIWQAATTRQQHFACGEGPARRFFSEVLPFAALENHSAEAVAALTALVSPGERVWLFEEPPPLDARQWRETNRIPGYQMACERLVSP